MKVFKGLFFVILTIAATVNFIYGSVAAVGAPDNEAFLMALIQIAFTLLFIILIKNMYKNNV